MAAIWRNNAECEKQRWRQWRKDISGVAAGGGGGRAIGMAGKTQWHGRPGAAAAANGSSG